MNHLRWDLSAPQIEALTKELIEQTKRVYDKVGAQEFDDVSYESTLKALADVEVTYTGEHWLQGRSRGHGERPVPSPPPFQHSLSSESLA